MLAGLLGLIRQIPLTGMIGDDGNAYYAAAFEICMVFLLLTSYCLPEAVAGMIEARISKEQYINAGRVLKAAFFFSGMLSIVGGAFLVLAAQILAEDFMKEPLCMYALRAFAPVLLLVTAAGTLRGFFQGMGTRVPTAVSRLLEELVLLITVLLFANLLSEYGQSVGQLLKNKHFRAAYGSMGAAAGISAGMIAGVLFLFFVYRIYRRVYKKQEQKDPTKNPESYGQLIKILVWTAVPLIVPGLLYYLSHIFEQALFNRYMIENGMEEMRAVTWGVYFGKYRVLTRIPVVEAIAVGLPMISGIVSAIGKSDYKQAKDRMQTILHLIAFLTLPWCMFLGVLAKPVTELLYNGETETAISLLRTGSLMPLLLAAAILTNGILQGIERSQFVMRNVLVAFVIQMGFFYVSLQYLGLGVHAAVYAEMLGTFILFLLNLWSAGRILRYRQEWVRTFVVPLIASAGMGVAEYLLFIGFSRLMGNLAVLPVMLLGAVLYLVAVLALHGISEKELSRIPFGELIRKAAKAAKLL